MGKSPMKTVWLLISPVVLLVNSAVTNSGAAYVMSLSLHSSTEYLVGSNRWSRKLSDIEPEKSSIGEISSKISSRPEDVDRSVRPASMPSCTRACQASLPTGQSNDVVGRGRRCGTSSGSGAVATETRDVLVEREVRGEAKTGSFRRQRSAASTQPAGARLARPTASDIRSGRLYDGSSAKRECSRGLHACRGGDLCPPRSDAQPAHRVTTVTPRVKPGRERRLRQTRSTL